MTRAEAERGFDHMGSIGMPMILKYLSRYSKSQVYGDNHRQVKWYEACVMSQADRDPALSKRYQFLTMYQICRNARLEL